VVLAGLTAGLLFLDGGEDDTPIAMVPAMSPTHTPQPATGYLLSLPFGGGFDIIRVPTPTPRPPATPVPAAAPAALRPAGPLLCYRPDLVSCATETAIAWAESTHGLALYNPTPVWLNGVEHHAIGWFGMLFPLHSWTGLTPGGGLGSDTAAFYELVYDQGLSPWY